MHIKIIFDALVLINGITNEIKEINYELYMNVKQCSETELVLVNAKGQGKGISLIMAEQEIRTFENYSQMDAYLKQQSTTFDFILFFYGGIYNRQDNVIYMPVDFYGDLGQFEHLSFTEHAKNKLLYNELSKYYMESIANDTEAEVCFLNKVFQTYYHAKTGNVLDCCCGIGRHDYRLALKGYIVTGIDISETQIDNANRVHSHQNVNYTVGDIRSFDLQEKTYDMAICMWTTYNYLSLEEDLIKFFRNVHHHLNEGGIFILDSKNIPALDQRRVYSRTTYNEKIELNLFVCKRIINNIQNSQYFYFIKDHMEKSFYFDEEFVRFYYLDELSRLANPYFEVITCYGNFNGELYKGDSDRFIVILKKRSSI